MEGCVPTSTVIANLKLLNLYNYDDWSIRANTYLCAEDLWDVVVSTAEPPKLEDGEAEYKAWRMKDAKALYAIQSSCGDDTFSWIRTKTRARDAWDTLLRMSINSSVVGDEVKDVRSLLEAYPEAIHTPINHQLVVIEEVCVEVSAEKSVHDANPPIGQAPDDHHSDIEMEEGRVEGAGHDESKGTDKINETFVNLFQRNEWDAAIKYLKEHPQAARARDSSGYTVLHHALAGYKNHSIVAKKLVRLMTAKDLEIKNEDEETALNLAIRWGYTDVVKCMLEKNNKLVSISSDPDKYPIAFKELEGTEDKEEMAKLLYSYTPHQDIKVTHAADLVTQSLKSKRFDIAWDLIQRYPKLAIAKNSKGVTPLAELAGISSAFLSGIQLKFWEEWIYDGTYIKPTPTIQDDDIQEKVQKREREDKSKQRHLICSARFPAIWCWNAAVRLFRRLVVTNLVYLLGIKRIYKIKLIHARIHEFLAVMFKALEGSDLYSLEAAAFLAIQRGHWEYIMHLCNLQFSLDWMANLKGQSLCQFAVECRQEKIYNILYATGGLHREEEVQHQDKERNTTLHTVGSISPLTRIDRIRGAPLQMQRELQWFKEVERGTLLTLPTAHELLNRDQMTPREVFTKNHEELLKKGEASMKEIATSCTVVGALIVTMMFAAAFTVPGGNNGGTGLPIFLSDRVFKNFIVSDAISLFSSTTSVMIFLGILTSRYAEEDFLVSLPRKMILGLLTLFFSIATMMIAFSSALYILLQGNTSIIFPLILLSSVPITSFIWLQFPLLVDICISTYGAGIFVKKVKP